MSNLKFKLYDKKTDKIVNYVDCSISIADGGVQSLKNGTIKGTFYNRHLIPIQYAGKNDMNNVEIYQGFIVKREGGVIGEEDITGIVEFDECSWWIVNKKEQRAVRLFSETAIDRIIGNVYQNRGLAREIGYELKVG